MFYGIKETRLPLSTTTSLHMYVAVLWIRNDFSGPGPTFQLVFILSWILILFRILHEYDKYS
jgi:hypothetical protein